MEDQVAAGEERKDRGDKSCGAADDNGIPISYEGCVLAIRRLGEGRANSKIPPIHAVRDEGGCRMRCRECVRGGCCRPPNVPSSNEVECASPKMRHG